MILGLHVDAADDVPGLVDYPSNAPEVARVVEGHATVVLLDLRQLALLLQFGEDL